MPRDARAYLSDIIDSCDVITEAVLGLDLAGYEGNRLVRSSVERREVPDRQVGERFRNRQPEGIIGPKP